MLRIIGDSHAQACFQGFPGAEIEAINSRTAWRIARDGVEIEGKVWTPPSADDVTCWCFGEIDCRCHIVRISIRDVFERTMNDVVTELSRKYVRRIAKYPGRKIICSVVPPSDLADSPEYPISGELRMRARATQMFNTFNWWLCQECNVEHCNFYDAYALPDGSLNQSLSDGNVHVATEHNQACRDALSRMLGIKQPKT
jgi:hypothetical protein